MAEEPEEDESHVAELVILALYGFGIGLNVYIIADQLSDGKLTRNCSMAWQHFKGAIAHKLQAHKARKSDESKVVWEAINIVEGRDVDNG